MPLESHLTPAAHMPWPMSIPFRMRPGLSRLSPDPTTGLALFLRDPLAPVYAAQKALAMADPLQPVQAGNADPLVLEAVADAYASQTGEVLKPTPDALALGLQEDFVLLRDEPDGFRVRFLSVCFPSNWTPADKLGLDFTAIHAPVADNALLQAGARGITDMAFRQSPMLRHVWLLSPSADLAQYPQRRRRGWEEALAQADADNRQSAGPGRLIDQLFFRVERQTTLPLPTLQHGVFFIRVMVCPLTDLLAAEPGRAADLHAALASMSEAVLAYRGMAAVRERLLSELVQAF